MNDTIHKEFFIPEKPEPLFKATDYYNPYPIDSLGCLKDVVLAMHDKSKAPIAIAGQSALSIASLCVQHLKDVETLGGYKPCSLFAWTIADSGERKSACDSLLMDGVYEGQKLLAESLKQEQKKYDIQYEAYKAEKDKILKKFRHSKSQNRAGLENALEVLGEAPIPPVSDIIITTDPTYEGLFMLFVHGRPSLGLFTDEGGLFVGGHGMNSDNKVKTMSGLSKFWDGSPLNRTRVSTPVETLYNKRLAAHILLQPAIANLLLGDVLAQSQGILARFLISRPESMMGYRQETDYDPKSEIIIEACRQKIKDHIIRPLHLEENSINNLVIEKIHLTDEGKEHLKVFYREIENELREGSQYYPIKAYASKAVEQVCRIAGVLTLFEHPHADCITLENIKNGIEIMRYHLQEALIITDGFIIPTYLQKAEKLRKWLIDEYQGDFINTRVIQQKAKGNFKTKQEAMSAINILVSHHWLFACDEPKMIDGHRSKISWRIYREEYNND